MATIAEVRGNGVRVVAGVATDVLGSSRLDRASAQGPGKQEIGRFRMEVMFKSCPRCSGDQATERDDYGAYVTCLACGYVEYPKFDVSPARSVAVLHEPGLQAPWLSVAR